MTEVTVAEQTAQMPVGYTDPLKYATDMLYGFYSYFGGPYMFEGTAEDDAAWWVARPKGVAELQRHIADDPHADIPDASRVHLRQWAAKGGE